MGRPASEDTIANLNKKIKELAKQLETLKDIPAQTPSFIQVNEDRDILVVSLYDGILNLSTDGYGKGEVYSFSYFGEERMIPLSDLKRIIRKEKKKITEGKAYINDPDIIKSERLTSAYKKILNKEKIEELFTKSKKLFKQSFDEMTKGQKEIFSQLIISKLKDGDDIDMNIVSIVSEAVGKDLDEIAQYARSFKNTKDK